MVRKLELIFSHSFDGKIWNMVSESSGRYLLLEIRHPDDFSTSFHIYDQSEGTILTIDIPLEERWWIGISHFTLDLIVFHTFPETDDPAIKDFFGYHVKESRILWTKSGVDILSFEKDSFNTVSKEGAHVERCDLYSGEIIAKKPAAESQTDTNFIRYPFHYVQGDEYFDTVQKFLGSLGKDHPERGVDYYEGNNVVVIAYYTGGTKLVNNLLVIDLNKNILLEEQLGSDLDGISDRAFFIFNDTLIFVKENRNFLSFQLPSA